MSSPTTRDLLKEMMNDLEKLDSARERLAFAISEVKKRVGGADLPERFKGMTKVEATKRCLSDHDKPLGTAEIVDSVLAGGFETKSNRGNFYTALYQSLTNQAKKPDKSGIKKVGKGKWALVKPTKNGGEK